MIILMLFKNNTLLNSALLYIDATNKAIYVNYIPQKEGLFGSMYFTLGLNRVIGYKDP